MRIAMVTESFPPEVNGMAITVRDWVHGLVDLGHDVEVIRPRQWRADRSRRDDHGYDHHTVPGLPLPGYPGLHFGLPAKRKLVRRWREQRPDVIHVSSEGPLGVTALRAARKLNIPTTTSFHTNFHEYMRHYHLSPIAKIAETYLRWVHKASDSVIVATEDMQKNVEKMGLQRVGRLPRGVDLKRFGPEHRSEALRESWGATPDTLVVGYVGRLADEKDLPGTFAMFEAIRAEVPEARMVVVGDGPIGAKLKRKYPDYFYAGMQGGTDLAAHYASIDLFMFASTTETFGNVVIEAMASGVPVAAYDYAGPQRLAARWQHQTPAPDTPNIALAPFGDHEALKGLGIELAKDGSRRDAMRSAARASVQGLGWASVMKRYEAWLADVAEHGRVTRPELLQGGEPEVVVSNGGSPGVAIASSNGHSVPAENGRMEPVMALDEVGVAAEPAGQTSS